MLVRVGYSIPVVNHANPMRDEETVSSLLKFGRNTVCRPEPARENRVPSFVIQEFTSNR